MVEMPAATPARIPRKFDFALEGLRGLACLVVLFSHTTPAMAAFYFFPGSEAVLIFFLISGYVIGRTYDTAYSPEGACEYVWRRFIRLAPLNFLAVILSVAVCPIDSISTIFANIFFLQNWEAYPGFRLHPLKANWNLWSLNSEVVYYAIFLIFWRKRISSQSLVKLLALLVVLSLTGWLWRGIQPKIVTFYCFGAIFWCSGLWLAWYGNRITGPSDSRARLPWISIWLLFLATVQYHVPFSILDYFGYGWRKHSQISFVDLEIFPLAFIILAGATSRAIPKPRLWWALALVQPLFMLEWNALKGNAPWLAVGDFGVGNLLALLGLLFWPLKSSNRWLTFLGPVGLISYGIYIFQAPAINFVELHWPHFSVSPLNDLARFSAILILTLFIAFVGEWILQPRIRKFLDQRFSPLRHKTPEVPALVP